MSAEDKKDVENPSVEDKKDEENPQVLPENIQAENNNNGDNKEEENKEEIKEKNKEENKEEIKEEIKEEKKEENKEEKKEENREEIKEENKEENKEKNKEEIKEEIKEENKEKNEEILNNEDANQNKEEEKNDEELNKSNSDVEVNVITYPLKLVFIGDSNVGKTSIIQRFCEQKFEEGIKATVSVAFQNKKLKIDPFTEVNMNIWDTAGQEKYRSLTRNYLRDSDGIFIVFDLSLKKSFDSLNSWLEEIKNSDIKEKCVKILIGNKSDIKEKEIDDETINKFAEENDFKYLAVSAKDGVNIGSMFEIMGGDCAKILQEEMDENNKNGNNNQIKKKEDEKIIVKNEENINKGNLVKKKNSCC